MRIKKLLMLLSFAFAIVLFGITTVNAIPDNAPVIKGNSVFRTESTTATVHFISDKAGTIYYKININGTAPSVDDLTDWTNGGEIDENVTKSMTLTGLTRGSTICSYCCTKFKRIK